MIQELKIKNFLSFKDEVTFSFEATKDKTFQDYQTVEVVKGVRLLRFAVVFGANASGKTNLLNAFNFLSDFWFNQRSNLNDKILSIPFKLDKNTPDSPSIFSLIFYVNGKKFWYQLEVDEYKVHYEKLSYYTSVQPTMLFERKLKDNVSHVTFNQAIVKVSSVVKEEINVKCLTNMSFFAARNQVNTIIPEVDDAAYWMRNCFMPVITPTTSLFGYAERNLQDNDALKTHLLEFLSKADFNIIDVISEMTKGKMPDEYLDFLFPDKEKFSSEFEKAKNEKNFQQIKTDFVHTVTNKRGKEIYILPKELQSRGTHQIFGLETAIFNALKRESFLSIDEIESSLHPYLVEFILKKFLEEKNNKAQLLITTHYDPLLNGINELFRKDSVWFTEKNEAGATELYALVEFSGLNRLSSIQKAYKYGNFGAIPRINF